MELPALCHMGNLDSRWTLIIQPPGWEEQHALRAPKRESYLGFGEVREGFLEEGSGLS